MSVEAEVRKLRKDLKKLRARSPEEIARQLPAFRCARCAKCCRAAFGDNTVTVFPGEVRAILELTGLEWLDVAEPEEEGDVDRNGNRQAFEWALRRKPKGDCIFLEEGGCSIYAARPFICRTYPFYLEDGKAVACECDGLQGRGGLGESGDDALALAKELQARHIRELEESILLLERLDMDAGRRRRGLIVVHDSEGSKLLADEGGRLRFC